MTNGELNQQNNSLNERDLAQLEQEAKIAREKLINTVYEKIVFAIQHDQPVLESGSGEIFVQTDEKSEAVTQFGMPKKYQISIVLRPRDRTDEEAPELAFFLPVSDEFYHQYIDPSSDKTLLIPERPDWIVLSQTNWHVSGKSVRFNVISPLGVATYRSVAQNAVEATEEFELFIEDVLTDKISLEPPKTNLPYISRIREDLATTYDFVPQRTL